MQNIFQLHNSNIEENRLDNLNYFYGARKQLTRTLHYQIKA